MVTQQPLILFRILVSNLFHIVECQVCGDGVREIIICKRRQVTTDNYKRNLQRREHVKLQLNIW